MKSITPSIYESFNARALQPEQVAKTFIPSKNFEKLAERSHSLVVGPRGSGKTTLLKMIQVRALESWQHEQSQLYRKKIDFTGVYIPADRAWGIQLDSIGGNLIDAHSKKILGIAAFTTHVLRSLIEVMEYRSNPEIKKNYVPFLRVRIDNRSEIQMVKELNKLWEIKTTIPSLSSLKISLSDRLLDLYKIAGRLMGLSEKERLKFLSERGYLNLHFIHASKVAIERFDTFSNANEPKWAFLFDEMEIVPEWISQQLIEGLRSVDDSFLFKLSFSPFNKVFSDFSKEFKDTAAQKGQDFDMIPLWYAKKNEAYGFCVDLFNGMLKEKGISKTDPNNILGRSLFDTMALKSESKTLYLNNSEYHKRLIELSKKDPSFKTYLNKKKIDLSNIEKLSGEKRAQTLRKIVQIVAFRNFFLKSSGSKPQMAPYKIPIIYSGARNIFAIVEGNPRIFIGLMHALIGQIQKTEKIKKNVQAREIKALSHRFQAMLSTIPCKSVPGVEVTSLLSLLDKIGDYFQRITLIEPFNHDLPLSFTIDKNIPMELEESLAIAINCGAIIHITESNDAGIIRSLRNEKFRLSYFLAQHYNLPLIMTGKSEQLSKILNISKPKVDRQYPLFSDI